ncbi:MAG: polyribonucleotide nucleotidyltransferase [Peptococcaceae bacterium]|jgi:polyribonucleotide nucleotidyltransferase|nr:polyribonucleotide nucleotidyltransferase [Peptococcaceae bacterium]
MPYSDATVLRKEMTLAGRALSLETGRLARQAGGAVFASYGDTRVLVSATASKNIREGIDFFPLSVEYEEKMYSVGKIPGGFIKREGRPSEKAILSARLIDRPIRPLFPEGFRNEVQVVATVFSVEHDNPPEILAGIAASAALMISDIPFAGPTATVAVGLADGRLVLSPTIAQNEESLLNLTVAGTAEAIMMVEAGAREVSEETCLDAIMFGHEAIREITAFIQAFRQEALAMGLAKEKITPTLAAFDPVLADGLREYGDAAMLTALRTPEKLAREAAVAALKTAAREKFILTFPERGKEIDKILEDIEKDHVRRLISIDKIRPDGRAADEIRPIRVEAGVLPRAHGSGLFTRGQTQVLNVTTLGTAREDQLLDGLGLETSKRYLHHYNFPPFSVGETKPMRGPGRREIGHGALAERALEPMIPPMEDFPYTIRLVSEVLESNGSSSMASVCGSTISLMDAGVPIKRPVAGIAMGLIKEGEHYTILSDIQGLEDHHGDMDFKVAGTEKGVTALQMDIKVDGLSRQILADALKQAHEGRLFILGKILAVIAKPKPELSPYAPRIITLTIDPDKIRDVIGPGGKIIKKIVEETGVKIDIEDSGLVMIATADAEAGAKAVQIVRDLTRDVVVGEIYTGKVTRLMNFGAFVEVLPGKEGLVHISHLAETRVNKVEDVVNVGDIITVKVTEIDRQGRVNLSLREALRQERKKQ